MTHLYECKFCHKIAATLCCAHYHNLYRCGVDYYECEACKRKYFVEMFEYRDMAPPRDTTLPYRELFDRAWFCAQHGYDANDHLDTPTKYERHLEKVRKEWDEKERKQAPPVLLVCSECGMESDKCDSCSIVLGAEQEIVCNPQNGLHLCSKCWRLTRTKKVD